MTAGGLGYIIYLSEGGKTRLEMTANASQANDLIYERHWTDWSLCKDEGESKGCRILNPFIEPSIAVIGDSHAGHLASGLAEIYRNSNENVIIRLGAGCMPFYSTKIDNQTFFTCTDNRIEKALDRAISETSIKTIILSGYGNEKIHGRRNASVNTQSYFYGYTSSFSEKQIERNKIAFKRAMHNTLSKLTRSDQKIIFIVDIPELNFNPLECVSLRGFTFSEEKLRYPCSLDRKSYEARTIDYLNLIKEAEFAFPNVKFIHTYNYLCDDTQCDITVNDKLLYSTRDHLTTYGSCYLMNKIKEELVISDESNFRQAAQFLKNPDRLVQ